MEITSETHLQREAEIQRRYTRADLAVLTPAEAKRFVPRGPGDPRIDPSLAWELLYRLEPELYDRLVSAERLHPGVLDWLPEEVGRIVEVGAGTGRLTLELIDRAEEVVAVEPAAPLRGLLARKLEKIEPRGAVRVTHGFFDKLPVADGWADLVVACSALTPAIGHGGDPGLDEMERVCSAGGSVVIVWPNTLDWLASHGYRYLSFEGEMFMEFAGYEEAVELTEIFHPGAAAEVRRRGGSRVPYEVLGVNPPRDLAYKVVKR